MTRDQAIKRLKRLLGPKAYWRIDDAISSPEKRERYKARRAAAREAFESADANLRARRDALLAADEEYQRLNAIRRAAHKAREDTRYHDGEGGYKFEVGTRNDIFIQPKAYGDTWEDIFAKLEGPRSEKSDDAGLVTGGAP